MGRHQQHRTARGTQFALGAATLAGLACSATYALAAPAAVVVPAPSAAPVVMPSASTSAVVAKSTSHAASPATTTRSRVTTSCDLSGPPVFGDPAHPDEITNRDCGYVDAQGRHRSRDPWIDGQLTDAG